MLRVEPEYTVQAVHGRLVVNDEPVDDHIDTDDRAYTFATRLKVNQELLRVASVIFSAGRTSKDAERQNVPFFGDVS